MEEVKYLLDVLIRNFCDSRVRDVRIEIERDAIAVDKICIHSCIVPVIIFRSKILFKRDISLKISDINGYNLFFYICNLSGFIIKINNLRNKILEKPTVDI